MKQKKVKKEEGRRSAEKERDLRCSQEDKGLLGGGGGGGGSRREREGGRDAL